MFTLPRDIISTEGIIDKKIIISVIEEIEKRKQRYELLERYYEGRMAVLERKKASILSNVKIVVNHAKYITDINVGYLLGRPVDYKTNEDIDLIKDEYKKQKIHNLDNALAKGLSKYGIIYEYVYNVGVSNNFSIHSKIIEPEHAIIVYDDTLEHLPLFALTYSEKTSDGKYKNVVVLTDTQRIDYNENLTQATPVIHGFKNIPLIEYHNNENLCGDFEPVISLIDAYNILQSDRVNDKQQLVEAFLVLNNITLTDKQKQDLDTYRIISVGKDGKAEYVIKNVNETEADVLRKALENDIHKISMTPNMSDENFVGNSSGVAIKYKLLPFEQNIINKQNYFEIGLVERLRLYNNFFVSIGKAKEIKLEDIEIVFTRNLPSNDLETSQIIANLTGLVSDETLISQLSFVADATEEMKKIDEQKIKEAKTQSQDFGTINTAN